MSEGGLRRWHDPRPGEVPAALDDFLDRLGAPTWLELAGRDRSRCRAFATLLHGNEPSGLRALHAWLLSGETPAVDLVCFVGAVAAARAEPRFETRMRPGTRDLNRCFRAPFDDAEGRLAAEVLKRMRERRPECLLDLHNTSGSGPAYGVATRIGAAHRAMAALFTDHVILTDLRLGTLIEALEDELPALVVECGGARDAAAHRTARDGFFAFARAERVLDPAGGLREAASRIEILEHPIRVELAPGFDVAYARAPVPGADVTLRPDVDQHNFGVVPAGTAIGWLGAAGFAALRARCREGREHVDRFFRIERGALVLRRDLRLFMITTRPEIARSDCLFYALPLDPGSEAESSEREIDART